MQVLSGAPSYHTPGMAVLKSIFYIEEKQGPVLITGFQHQIIINYVHPRDARKYFVGFVYCNRNSIKLKICRCENLVSYLSRLFTPLQ